MIDAELLRVELSISQGRPKAGTFSRQDFLFCHSIDFEVGTS